LKVLCILVVEDDHFVRLIEGELLRDEGFDVEEASSGDEACLRLVGPEFFDVLLTVVQMPGEMDGVHVAAHTRGFHPAIILIIVSGFAPLVRGRLQDFNPAAVFFPKPYQMPGDRRCDQTFSSVVSIRGSTTQTDRERKREKERESQLAVDEVWFKGSRWRARRVSEVSRWLRSQGPR
jgi:CheY-like chemotaxis protein